MVFKLVPIDSENPSKIKLEPGTHNFGRGKFLNVNDKRISRLHGQFEVTDDSLIITALHQNPCFFKKSGSLQGEVLKQNNSVSLTSGDKLGLLPTSHWFEVLQCVQMDTEDNKETPKECHENTNNETPADSGGDTDNEGESRLHSITNVNGVPAEDNQESQSTDSFSPCELDKEQNSNDQDKENCDAQDAAATEDTSVNSRLATDCDTDKTHTDEPGSASLLTTNQEIEDEKDEAGPSSSNQSNATQKRPHSDDEASDEVKKIKTESDVIPDVKADPDGQQAGSSNSNNNDGGKTPTLPLRERCMYGASCYRRNPAHLAQFSHPPDADWGAGERAPCPWGAACGKRDPRHWRDHDHPPGKQQPPPQPGKRGKTVNKRNRRTRKGSCSASDESDRDPNRTDGESDEPQHLIVTGKRVRRPRIAATLIDSDDDSDPYKTDAESDEWEPPTSEYTESQN